MNKPEYIIVHHTAVSRDNNSNQFDAVKRYHIGKGWGDIGYHWFIEPNGEIKQGRPENLSGAHCYQERMNYRSIGVCLAGHFDNELPTPQQQDALTDVLEDVMERYNIPPQNVVGHRMYAPKTCPGKMFTDELLNSLIQKDMFDAKEVAKQWGAEAEKALKWYEENQITSVKDESDLRMAIACYKTRLATLKEFGERLKNLWA